MLNLTTEFKQRVRTALLEVRKNYSGPDSAFAQKWGLNGSIYSRLKNGEIDNNIIHETKWLTIGRELDVTLSERSWKPAKTDVFTVIEQDVDFCQAYAKSRIFVDDCGIGKTYAAKYLSKNRKNCFYVDASQSKTKQLFIRQLAKALGVDSTGKYAEVYSNIIYYLKVLTNPLVIIDEAGKLNKDAFEEVQCLWNATEYVCGWYMMGANGFRKAMGKGIANDKEGFAEIFSRFQSRFSSIVPNGRQDKQLFLRKLITDVLTVNMDDKSDLQEIVKRCLNTDADDKTGPLRRAESMLIAFSNR